MCRRPWRRLLRGRGPCRDGHGAVRPAICHEDRVRPGDGNGEPYRDRDGVPGRDQDLQGPLLRDGARHQDRPALLHGHGAAAVDAHRMLLRGHSLYAASDRVLRSGGAHDADGARHLHGLRSGLHAPDGAVYGDGAQLRDAARRPLRDALRAGQRDLHEVCRQGPLAGPAGAGVRALPADANVPLLGAELGQ